LLESVHELVINEWKIGILILTLLQIEQHILDTNARKHQS